MATIPPDNVASGQSGHITHHNEISDVLTDHETRVTTAEGTVSNHTSQITTLQGNVKVYVQSSAPTPGTAFTQLWIDTT